MRATSPVPTLMKDGSLTTISRPSASTKPTPRTTARVPRVVMRGLIRPYPVIAPLPTPTASPMSTATTAAPAIPQPCPTTLEAPRPAAADTEPTERSNPPETITIVSPAAMIPVTAIRLAILTKLLTVKNTGERHQNTRISTARITKRPGPMSPTAFRAHAQARWATRRGIDAGRVVSVLGSGSLMRRLRLPRRSSAVRCGWSCRPSFGRRHRTRPRSCRAPVHRWCRPPG